MHACVRRARQARLRQQAAAERASTRRTAQHTAAALTHAVRPALEAVLGGGSGGGVRLHVHDADCAQQSDGSLRQALGDALQSEGWWACLCVFGACLCACVRARAWGCASWNPRRAHAPQCWQPPVITPFSSARCCLVRGGGGGAMNRRAVLVD
eukprot:COSAG01_NODE_1613_length_9731_cov_11.760590_12_plen_154_part_00